MKCVCVRAAGEAALKSAQLELQLQSRKQEAAVEMVQAKLQQQAAALVREGRDSLAPLADQDVMLPAPTVLSQELFEGLTTLAEQGDAATAHNRCFRIVRRLHLTPQEAERAELERLSNQVAAERDTLEAAATALQEQQQQQGAAAGDLSARESALEARAAALQRQQGALQAAQAAALKQLDSLEASLRSKLEGHQKQVRLCQWLDGSMPAGACKATLN